MGLFSFFKKNQPNLTLKTDVDGGNIIEIPKNIFIEERDPHEQMKPNIQRGTKWN